jgi:hypothetical protein
MAPRVRTKDRQPQFSERGHCPSGVSSGQEKLGMKPHATATVSHVAGYRLLCSLLSEAITCPIGQKTDNRVSRLLDDSGRNSRNSAPSTGKLPPTPNPRQLNSAAVPIQLGPPPAASPKAPARNSVKLKAKRRPTTSEAVPQKLAPMQRPKKRANVVYLMLLESTPNSTAS